MNINYLTKSIVCINIYLILFVFLVICVYNGGIAWILPYQLPREENKRLFTYYFLGYLLLGYSMAVWFYNHEAFYLVSIIISFIFYKIADKVIEAGGYINNESFALVYDISKKIAIINILISFLVLSMLVYEKIQ